jgi:membrane protein YqaA with SNARE-associated domain
VTGVASTWHPALADRSPEPVSIRDVIRDALLLLWVCFIGTVFVPINPDAAVVIYLTTRHRPLLEAVAIAMAGQMAMLLLLYFLGDRLRARSRWLARRCEQVQARWGPRLATGSLPLAATSGFIGLPPSAPTKLLGAALRLPRRFLLVFVVFRVAWFVSLGWLGHAIWGS